MCCKAWLDAYFFSDRQFAGPFLILSGILFSIVFFYLVLISYGDVDDATDREFYNEIAFLISSGLFLLGGIFISFASDPRSHITTIKARDINGNYYAVATCLFFLAFLAFAVWPAPEQTLAETQQHRQDNQAIAHCH